MLIHWYITMFDMTGFVSILHMYHCLNVLQYGNIYWYIVSSLIYIIIVHAYTYLSVYSVRVCARVRVCVCVWCVHVCAHTNDTYLFEWIVKEPVEGKQFVVNIQWRMSGHYNIPNSTVYMYSVLLIHICYCTYMNIVWFML